jgi:hypothetical protein
MGHGMLQNRVRGKSLIVGDSGGYQFAKATKVWGGDLTRRAALNWCEANTDVSMTLDIPTRAISVSGSGFSDFKSCLETSVESLRYYMINRTGSMRLLNVLQGRSQDEADAWFAAVKDFSCEGWAFAGDLRQNFYQVCRRVLQLIDAGLIGAGRNHIHVLGTARLSTAVALTALQRTLRKNVHESIFITFDAATPSILASNYKAIWAPALSAREFLFRGNKVPCTSDYVGSRTPFPFGSSAVARRLLLRDLCVNSSPVKQASFDVLSGLLLTNHNVESLLAAIGAANGVADFIGRDREAFVPPSLLRGLEAIGRVFEGDTGRRLAANRNALENLSSAGDGVSVEDEGATRT